MSHVALALLAVASAPVLLATGYLAVLALLSARGAPPPAPAGRPRFDVVVPAHDEEAGIARTVRSLLALEWPADRFRVVVVADNCGDATAARAAEAGATVLERRDPDRRGKGYALEYAFERCLAGGGADAVVVVDADTLVSPNLLSAFAARLERGALALQARYGVSNPEASWRTRLMALAFALFHDLRSLGRERCRLSCGLRGNGMCFTREALARAPHDAFSVVEDLEYGIRLGRAGIRVWYVDEAAVLGDMVAGASASRSQRLRWEGGRMAILRREGLPLLAEGLARRDGVLLDLAMDVLVPPLSWVAAAAALGTAAAAVLVWRGAPGWTLWPWLAACGCLAVYLMRGTWLSGMGLRAVATLAWAPVFVLWKVVLWATRSRRGRGEWVRTHRPTRPD